jgi:hypothetical protein
MTRTKIRISFRVIRGLLFYRLLTALPFFK